MVRVYSGYTDKFLTFNDHAGSDILYMKVLGTSMVVINSVDIAMELLERRSAIYSDRVHSVVLDDLYVMISQFLYC
jgi:hypothetical protein